MINLEILNQNEEVNVLINLHQVVSKPLEKLQFSKFLDERSIGLDYFESVEINSEEHLELNDLSWKASQNNLIYFDDIKEGKTENNVINSLYRDLLLTNTVLRNTKENIEIPLWYKHKRKNIKEVNFHILDRGTSIDIEEGFILKNGFVYTNYKNEFNKKSSNYRLYFLSGVTASGEAFNELLNVVPAIERTTFEDISLEDGRVINESYELTEDGYSYSYIVNYIESGCENETTSRYTYFKGDERNLIKLLKPETYSMSNPWFMRITNGHFVRRGKRYWVPEFINQPFDGQFECIRLIEKDCAYVTESIIKMPVNRILINPSELVHIDVHAFDESDEVVYALTTDINKIDTKYSNSEIKYQYGINSWDEEYGFVELDTSIDVSYKLKANFYYKTDCFLDKSLNVNFYSNDLLINYNILFYLIPDMQTKSVYYFAFDENDRIVESSNLKFKSIVNNRYNPNSYVGKNIETFRKDYCIGYSNNFQYLELGEISLKENYYLDESLSLDIREMGYLKESNAESYYSRQHKGLQSKHGYGENGQTIQKNNLLYIKYPLDLLETYGGQYKEKDLIRYSRRKLQPGADFVVDYQYPKSKLQFEINQSDITIALSWEGPGIYKLYRSLNEFSETIDENDEVVIIYEKESLNKENLLFIDDTIEADKIYWYSVRIDSYPKSNRYAVRSK